ILSTGKMVIKENRLDMPVDYAVPEENLAFELDLSEGAAVIGQRQAMSDSAPDMGSALPDSVTSHKALRTLAPTRGIQTLIYGSIGQGTYVSTDRMQGLFGQLFGFSTITTNDLRYKTQKADGTETTHRFFPQDKISFIAAPTLGVGLWGVSPEE